MIYYFKPFCNTWTKQRVLEQNKQKQEQNKLNGKVCKP